MWITSPSPGWTDCQKRFFDLEEGLLKARNPLVAWTVDLGVVASATGEAALKRLLGVLEPRLGVLGD